MGEFPSVELAQLIDPDRSISYGIVQPGSACADGVPIIRVSDVRNGRIATTKPLRVLHDIEAQYSRTRLRGGELLITIVGTVGETAIVPQSLAGWNVARAIAVLPVRSDVGAYWVQLALQSPLVRSRIDSRLNTTVQATLNLGDLAKLPILLPPKPERERIEALVGALDRKNDLNRRINETLDTMARAIFRDWFVDFGPTKAKVEGRATYLAPELWSLFPNQLDDEDRPLGWRQRPVYGIAKFVNGAAYKDMHFSAERNGLPVIKIAELKAGITATTKFTATNLGEKYRVDSGEVLFSWSGNPDTSIDTFIWDGGPGWLNQHIFRVRENGSTPRAMTYFQLKILRSIFAEIARNEQTTGLGHVTAADMKRLMVCDPPTPVACAYEDIAGPSFQRIMQNQLQSRTLTRTRDLLLPKLMSGEIRVKEAEKEVQAVA